VGHGLGHSKATADYRERPASEPFEEAEMLAVDPLFDGPNSEHQLSFVHHVN
jgi:hypothetical protein